MARHRTAHVAVQLLLLLVLLLLLCCLSGCSALSGHSCMFDQIAAAKKGSPPPASAVRELPRKAHTAAASRVNSKWAPIRIHVSAEDVKDTSKYCTAVNEERPDFCGNTVKCAAEHLVTEEKKTILLQTMLPEAIKLHSDRLRVEPLPYAIKVSVPSTGHCSLFTIPESHKTDGLPKDGLMLYVAAGPGHSFAEVCTEESEDGRPIASVLQVDPAYIGDGRFNIRVVAHEIAHALGFEFERMRKKKGKNKMIDSIFARGKKQAVYSVESKKTKEAARNHYNCSTARGMELEDEVTNWSSSHWERRNARDELMSAYVDPTGGAYYTALTLAAFEDLGYYRANFGMAESMSWGRNAGCDFLREKCIENNVTKFPEMFCTEVSSALKCTSDRYALGKCALEQYEKHLDVYFQYFDKPAGGPASALTDYCPVITPTVDTLCSSGKEEMMPGSRLGPMSRCLNGNSITLQTPTADGPPVGDVCANVKCDDGAVQVQYRGDETWHSCEDGTSLSLAGSVFSGGTIVCPKYEDVCTVFEDSSEPDPDPDPQPQPQPEPEPEVPSIPDGSGGNTGNTTRDGSSMYALAHASQMVLLLLLLASV